MMRTHNTHSAHFSQHSPMPLLHQLSNLLLIIRLGCENVKSPATAEDERLAGIRQIEGACDEMAQLMRLFRETSPDDVDHLM